MEFVPPVIPADGIVDAALTIAVLVIAFIGWIMKIVGQAKEQEARPMNRPRPAQARAPQRRPAAQRADDRLREEIDSFLREAAGKPRQDRREPPEEVVLEVIPDEDLAPTERQRRLSTPLGETTAVAAAPRQGGQPSEWDREQQRKREQLLSRLPSRHLDATPLGRELRNHVEQFAAESSQLQREKEQAEQRLAEARAELRSMRAQVAAGPAIAPVAASNAGSRFAALLKNRKSVKDAIVVNEVLSRPRGLRRTS